MRGAAEGDGVETRHHQAGGQPLPTAELAQSREARATQPARREGGQEGGYARFEECERVSKGARVPGTANQALSSSPERWDWVDRTIWTERMLAALGNGVQGGK